MKKFVLSIIFAGAIVAGLIFATAQTTLAHGPRCYDGLAFYERTAGGSNHWYVHVPIDSQDYDKPVTAWHVHGPRNPSLWPDSAPGRYIMVYFSWPSGVNPYLVYSPSQFQACLN